MDKGKDYYGHQLEALFRTPASFDALVFGLANLQTPHLQVQL
jgi:hypothetical protein